jgi:hypothetical protein
VRRTGQACERRNGEIRSEAVAGSLEEEKSQEHPAYSARIVALSHRKLPDSMNPGAAVARSEPPLAAEPTGEETAGGFATTVTSPPCSEGIASKGKPQERCRHETGPTTPRRKETVERAAKP